MRCCRNKSRISSCSAGCLHFIGFIGVAIYYISTATGFWIGVFVPVPELVSSSLHIKNSIKTRDRSINMGYIHTQTGYLMLVVSAFVAVFSGVILSQVGTNPAALTVVVIVLVTLISFSSLTVTINESHLKIKFGWGIFIKNFSLKEIVLAEALTNHWYFGWGIRFWFWPKMVIFNVSGLDAVEIRLKNSKIYRIGTDRPKELEKAIKKAIS